MIRSRGKSGSTGRIINVAVIGLLVCSTSLHAGPLARIDPATKQFRGPVAVARLDETTVVVANRIGTISLVDVIQQEVVAEFQLGGRLTDLAVSRGRVLVTDSEKSRLAVLQVDRDAARLLNETSLPTHPVTIRVSQDGLRCSVASLWARSLSVLALRDSASAPVRLLGSVALPFSPREHLMVNDSTKIIVADAFGGRLAVVESGSLELVATHEFGAHNIRGLAINHKGRLQISHQVLNHRAVPRRGDIIWGVMVDNLIRVATLEKILNGDPKALQGNRFISVGYAGQGAGDPDSMFVDGQGRTVIALSGVGEVSIVEPDGNGFRRVAVGRRPVAVMPLSNDRFVAVNELSDSLSFIDLSEPTEEEPVSPPRRTAAGSLRESDGGEHYDSSTRYSSGSYGSTYLDSGVAVTHVPLGPTPDDGPAQRGERLFFDARLSHANWFSCHSCHTDGHTNGGMADTFGDDSTGAPKRVLSLLGVGETGPWGWNGKKNSLLSQIHQSAESTMKGRGVSKAEASDLAAFLSTLPAPPPFQKPSAPEDSLLITKGRGLFESLDCSACHRGHLLTSDETYDVGLEDERGLRLFNPPSLRGVGYRDRLFHDSRAAGVEGVVRQHQHQLKRTLSPDEQTALIRYLKSL